MHGGLSPELKTLEQIKRLCRPADVPDTGLLCDLLWADPEKEIQGWGENDRGVSYTFGADAVTEFLQKHDLDLICRAHQVRLLSPIAWQKKPGADLFSILIELPLDSAHKATNWPFCVRWLRQGTICRLSRTATSSSPRGSW